MVYKFVSLFFPESALLVLLATFSAENTQRRVPEQKKVSLFHLFDLKGSLSAIRFALEVPVRSELIAIIGEHLEKNIFRV